MPVNTSEFNCVYLIWQKCLASALLGNALALFLPPSYHPTHHPLMLFRLYTHAFFMIPIVSVVFAVKVNGRHLWRTQQ